MNPVRVESPSPAIKWPDAVADALDAWAELNGSAVQPRHVAALKESKASRVFRMDGLGPDGTSIVAKRRPRAGTLVEQAVYRRLRQHQSLPMLNLLGAVERGALTWLFFEYAGTDHYSPQNEEHVTALAEYLRRLHAIRDDLAQLPVAGPDRYLAQLRSSKARLFEAAADQGHRPQHRRAMTEFGKLLRRIEADWPKLLRPCQGWPMGLAHGDLQPKNIFVRRNRAGDLEILPVDWEDAGRGTGAADAASLAEIADVEGRLDPYRRALAPDRTPHQLSAFIRTGVVFRYVAAVDWASRGLSPEWVAKPLNYLSVFAPRLVEAGAAAGLDLAQ